MTQVAVVMDWRFPLVLAELAQPMTYERWLQWHFTVLLPPAPVLVA